MEEMIEGKEIEIYGLRHQLQSFQTGRGLCSNCSRPSVTTLDSGDSMKARSNAIKDSIFNLTNKRPHTTVSSSLSDGMSESNLSSRIQQPIKKRPCVQESGAKSTDIENNNATPNGNPKLPSIITNQSQYESEVSKSESTTLTISVFPVGSLSPPSQMYDASLAIKNAINHNDLADYDATYRDTSMLDLSQKINKRNMLLSEHKNHSGPMDAGSIPRGKNLDQLTSQNDLDQAVCRKSKRIHRPSCRYFRRTVLKESKQGKQTSDDTGDDISLPSGFLESDTSAVPPKSITTGTTTDHRHPKTKSHFPSIGGSPTHNESDFKFPAPPQRATLVGKKPLASVLNVMKSLDQPDANSASKKCDIKEDNGDGDALLPCDVCDRVYKHYASLWRHKNFSHRPKQPKSLRRSSSHTPPSTPDGFWNIDLEQSGGCTDDKEKENTGLTNTSDTQARIRCSSRRRRPLSFPSNETSAPPTK
ncbi:hypothetical protein EWB00_004625 [Schistosoma japonicum]|uniref:C2H2-type domain-containing protein n=2 Tax=Schistosoma japonicum TaxID=6182 RepID=A0A4Z2D4N2_SCHJA|nr:hypothetical protein EWB00_004625 [Schistosoma japonicum]